MLRPTTSIIIVIIIIIIIFFGGGWVEVRGVLDLASRVHYGSAVI
jgi:hypothetical protein